MANCDTCDCKISLHRKAIDNTIICAGGCGCKGPIVKSRVVVVAEADELFNKGKRDDDVSED